MEKKYKIFNKTLVIALGAILIATSFVSFTTAEEKIGARGAILVHDPTSHDFGEMYEGETDSTTFEIWNAGDGTLYYVLIINNASWLEVYPLSGSSTGEHDTITVDIDTTGLEVGYYAAYILFNSSGGYGYFWVFVTVIGEDNPVLSYDPTSHDFGEMYEGQADITTFEIWNGGTGTLYYELTNEASWLEVYPLSGDSTGEHDVILVVVDTTGLSPGDYEYYIPILSNGGDGVFQVCVTVIELDPILSYDPTSYDFGEMEEGQTDSTSFEIWNAGNGTLYYELINNASWLDVYPLSGDSTGEHDIITVDIDTTGLDPGDYQCDIQIT